MPVVSVNGLDVNYRTAGEGFPVLLIHGHSGSLRNWVLQARALGEKYRTISPDLRGHGLSGKPTRPEDYSLEIFAEDVHGFLAELAVHEYYLIGHSLGGMVAQELILRHPDGVRALVLVDSCPDHPELGEAEMAERRRAAEIAQTQGMAALFEYQRSLAPEPPWLRESPEYVERWREQFLQNSVEGYVYSLKAVRERRPATDRLHEIRVPTLIVCGENDPPFLGPSRQMHDRIPGSELVILPGVGHTPSFEAPEILNRTLLDFLAQADAQRLETLSQTRPQ